MYNVHCTLYIALSKEKLTKLKFQRFTVLTCAIYAVSSSQTKNNLLSNFSRCKYFKRSFIPIVEFNAYQIDFEMILLQKQVSHWVLSGFAPVTVSVNLIKVIYIGIKASDSRKIHILLGRLWLIGRYLYPKVYSADKSGDPLLLSPCGVCDKCSAEPCSRC